MSRGLSLELSRRDRDQLDELLSGGLQPVRTVLRALALRQMDDGQSTPAVGVSLGLSAKAVWQIAKRYQQGGLDRALFDGARPGKSPALDQEQRQRIIAVACSPPPEGRARWTVRLLTEEAIRRKLVPRVGRETIRVLLESHDLKPWREKNVVRGEVDEEYIARMEDVLKLYERPLSGSEPVVCIDEKPVVLHQDTRTPIPMRPGRVARRDYEYKRCGTANVFCGVEPKAGRHFTKVTPTRCSAEFADYLLKSQPATPQPTPSTWSWTTSPRIRRARSWSGSGTAQGPGYGTDLRSTTRPNMEAG